MSFLKRVLVIGFALLLLSGEVCASEIMLKIACIETGALNAFRVPQAQFFIDGSVIDYSALAAALTYSVSGPADDVQNASIHSTRLVPIVLRDVPAALQGLYPEQGRLIGRQVPGGSSGWHKYLIDFSGSAQVAFVEVSVDHAVLDSLASGSAVAMLHDRSIQQYTHGSNVDTDAVFTAGYSFFIQQLARGNAYTWLEKVMPLKNGIGILALRRAGAETRTDTLILRIDLRSLPQSVSGRPEALVVLGWDLLK
jgi:hypothetical protein